MVTFCTGMSFVLTAVRELTGSLIPVATTHGMCNAVAPILLILNPDAHPILGGPLGLLGAAMFALLGRSGLDKDARPECAREPGSGCTRTGRSAARATACTWR